MAYKCGDVLLAPLPFSDLSAAKIRPAVVIGSAHYQRAEPDTVLAAITSNTVAAMGRFDLVLANWRAAGLKFPSAFNRLFSRSIPHG